MQTNNQQRYGTNTGPYYTYPGHPPPPFVPLPPATQDPSPGPSGQKRKSEPSLADLKSDKKTAKKPKKPAAITPPPTVTSGTTTIVPSTATAPPSQLPPLPPTIANPLTMDFLSTKFASSQQMDQIQSQLGQMSQMLLQICQKTANEQQRVDSPPVPSEEDDAPPSPPAPQLPLLPSAYQLPSASGYLPAPYPGYHPPPASAVLRAHPTGYHPPPPQTSHLNFQPGPYMQPHANFQLLQSAAAAAQPTFPQTSFPTTGELPNFVPPQVTPSVLPPVMDMSTQLITLPLSEKLQQKILTGQYVDFAELAAPNPAGGPPTQPYAILNTNLGALAVAAQEPNKKKGPITPVDWHKAFLIFQFYHAKAFPQEAQQLLAYGYHISIMMAEGTDWRNYDVSFRWERQHQVLKTRWDQFHSRHYSHSSIPRAATTEKSFPSQSPSGSFRKSSLLKRVPAGYCYKFHDPEDKCPDIRSCTFKHTCPECSEPHTISRHGGFAPRKEPTRHHPQKSDTKARDTRGKRKPQQLAPNSN